MFKKLLLIPLILLLSGCSISAHQNYNIDIKTYETIGGVKASTTIQVAAPGNIVPAGEWVKLPLENANGSYDVFSARLSSVKKATKEEASTMYSLDDTLKGQDIWIIKIEVKKEIGTENFNIGSMFIPVNNTGDKVQEVIYENWSPCNKNASIEADTTVATACYIASSSSASLVPAGISFVGSSSFEIDYTYETGQPVIMRIN